MVGDVSVDDAIKVTADTFGALPPRPALGAPAPGADVRRFPAPTAEPLKFTHKGLAEQSLGYVAWPTVDATRDLTEARKVEVLAAVLRLRVLEEIREKEGLAYSPGVSSSYSDTYKGYGTLGVQAQTAPDKLPAFFAAVDAIVQRLRDEPISADELKRAREPIIEGTKRGMTTNYWWLSQLTFLVDRPWYEPQALTSIGDMEALTPADIQALAQKYLQPGKAWRAEVMPADKGATAAQTAAK
jgi:zinc protease